LWGKVGFARTCWLALREVGLQPVLLGESAGRRAIALRGYDLAFDQHLAGFNQPLVLSNLGHGTPPRNRRAEFVGS
jgi:hypothetical protein